MRRIEKNNEKNGNYYLDMGYVTNGETLHKKVEAS